MLLIYKIHSIYSYPTTQKIYCFTKMFMPIKFSLYTLYYLEGGRGSRSKVLKSKVHLKRIHLC